MHFLGMDDEDKSSDNEQSKPDKMFTLKRWNRSKCNDFSQHLQMMSN
ncbi:unnamed protein product [Chironomus riparius]|uniref:Uncharacterized protein n=1 Tax=Chironomus riparius TaxID=315576 RepID=A0A9N9S8R5_9DIPT|nr:unnamed protein product [Chironomus riparius]